MFFQYPVSLMLFMYSYYVLYFNKVFFYSGSYQYFGRIFIWAILQSNVWVPEEFYLASAGVYFQICPLDLDGWVVFMASYSSKIAFYLFFIVLRQED